MQTFWTAPGPARALSRIVSDVPRGRAALLRVPSDACVPGLVAALSMHLKEIGWYAASEDDFDCRWSLKLARMADSGVPATAWDDLVESIVAEPTLAEQVLVVVIGCDSVIEHGLRLVADVGERMRRNAHGLNRGVVGVLVADDRVRVASAPGLEVHDLATTFSHADALHVAASHGHGVGYEDHIVASVAASLGGSDVDLIRALSRRTLASLCDAPEDAVRSAVTTLARQRVPSACRLDGRPHESADTLLQLGAVRVIWGRVWAGQSRVLFPTLYELRTAGVAHFRPHLRSVGSDRLSESEIDAMELGDFVRRLRHLAHRDAALWLGASETWVTIRNHLAHFEPVSSALIRQAKIGQFL